MVMGTRSVTFFKDSDDQVVCAFYRQLDGYPDGHGLDLAKLVNRIEVNGFNGEHAAATHFNGIGCLAASVIKGLKDGLGDVYMEAPRKGKIEGIDYVYTVRSMGEGKHPVIKCKAWGQKVVFDCPANEAEAVIGALRDE